MNKLKGWRTIAFGFVVAITPVGLTYLAGIDWTHLVGPNAALAITGIITIGLRLVTNTPVGQSK
jgi:hypothetical protein